MSTRMDLECGIRFLARYAGQLTFTREGLARVTCRVSARRGDREWFIESTFDETKLDVLDELLTSLGNLDREMGG